MRFIILAALLLLTPPVAVASLQPSDFAYGMPLALEGKGAVYRLVIPREIYESVKREDLADIRIFNDSQISVPHVLRRPKAGNEIPEELFKLPFFPLYRKDGSKESEEMMVRIERDADGTIIEIDTAGADSGPKRWLSAYIIDASQYKKEIHALEVTWLTANDSFVSDVTVETSNDLSRWTSLVSRAALVRMQFEGHKIHQNRILLPARRDRYLKLSWPAGRGGSEIKKILAIRKTGATEMPYSWADFKGKPGPVEDEKRISAYEYDAAAHFPADRIRLQFAEKNVLLKAAVFSRPHLDSEWQHRRKRIFYDLTFEEASLVQDTVSIPLTSDRYWRVEIETTTVGGSGATPSLELGWLPHELLFVAQGEAPFMLAYGSARLGDETANSIPSGLLAQVMGDKQEKLTREATPQSKIILGGPDQLVPKPPPLPWRKWLLWGVLVAGVGVIAKMALSLGKGLKKEAED